MQDAFRVFARTPPSFSAAHGFCPRDLCHRGSGPLTGPFFDYSDTWQLLINTSTTIVTFLMVFIIQNTQNRDSKAVHLKLDELIRVDRQRA